VGDKEAVAMAYRKEEEASVAPPKETHKANGLVKQNGSFMEMPELDPNLKVTVGVCVMEKKVSQRPIQRISCYLIARDIFIWLNVEGNVAFTTGISSNDDCYAKELSTVNYCMGSLTVQFAYLNEQ
jgi:hypothetical protein